MENSGIKGLMCPKIYDILYPKEFQICFRVLLVFRDGHQVHSNLRTDFGEVSRD